MPLEIIQTTEADTGWATTQQQNLENIRVAINDLETDTTSHPHQPARITDDVLFNDVDITNPSDIFNVMDTRYFTQAEVLELIAGAILSFWPSDTPDGVIGGYFRMFDDDTGEAKSSIGPVTIDAAEVLIASFITQIDSPDFAAMAAAVYNLEIHNLATVGANVKAARIRWKLYSRTQPGGVETLLITSEDSQILMDSECHCSIPGILHTETAWTPTDRLVLKVYGVPEGAQPQDPDVTIFMEGDTATRIETHTTIGVFDQRYLMLNGDNEMTADLDMGAHDIVDVGLVDTVDVAALKTDVDGFPDELKFLTQAEIQQLENIGATTLSATQWGYLGAQTGRVGMTDRGDPAAVDWNVGNFTTNGAWHALDCSGIVPAGAKTITFELTLVDNLVGVYFELRKNGNANVRNRGRCTTQVANISAWRSLICSCDANRIVEYRTSNTAIATLNLVVRGWWFE